MSDFTKYKALTYVVFIFLAGTVCGTIIGYASGRQQSVPPVRKKEMCDRTLKNLRARLNLTDEQVSLIKPIVEQNSAAMQSIQRECWQRASDSFKKMNARIAGYLTDEQRIKLDAMENQRCEAVRKKCGATKTDGQHR